MTKVNEVGTVATTVSNNGYGQTVCTYHQTAVVTWDDSTIELDTGGYNTVTTRRRMNQVSNVYNLGYQINNVHKETIVTWRGREYPYLGERVRLGRDSGSVEWWNRDHWQVLTMLRAVR